MIDSDFMTAMETALYVRLNFRKNSKPTSREQAFREFLNRNRDFPEPTTRTGRELWYRPDVKEWMNNDKAKKEAKVKKRKSPRKGAAADTEREQERERLAQEFPEDYPQD